MLFSETFISTSEKLGVGLKKTTKKKKKKKQQQQQKKNKQAPIYYFNFTRRWVVRYSYFDFFSSAIWRYIPLSGLWNTHLTYQIRRTATYVHVEIHKMLNFPTVCSGDWTICAEYDLWGRLPFYGGINPYGDKKANCQVSDCKAWLSLMGTLVNNRMARI